MTVSRTLGGGEGVSAAKQERVFDAIARLGYHRNENARSIRPGQLSGLIGVVITNIGNPYYASFVLGVEEVALTENRRIIMGSTSESVEREGQLVSDLISRQVEGLVIVPTSDAASLADAWTMESVPVVLASRTVAGLVADTVLIDDVGGAHRGTTALLERGHRRIGFLGTGASTFTGSRRLQGFSDALKSYGVEMDHHLVWNENTDALRARISAEALLGTTPPPTAVFCANNRNAVGLFQALARCPALSYSALRQLEVVSFDRFELAELMPVRLVIIDHDPRDLGRTAATMLFDRIRQPSAPARFTQLPTTLTVARH